jgi:hypothetical protein
MDILHLAKCEKYAGLRVMVSRHVILTSINWLIMQSLEKIYQKMFFAGSVKIKSCGCGEQVSRFSDQ